MTKVRDHCRPTHAGYLATQLTFNLINFAMESIPRFIRNLTKMYKDNRKACMSVTYVDEKVTLFLSLTKGFCF